MLSTLLDKLQTPRLKGAALAQVRKLAQREPFRTVARHQMGEAHDLPALLDLPGEAREAHDNEPRPIAGGPPHVWEDAEYDPPAAAPSGTGATDAPTSVAALRAAYHDGRTTPTEVLARIKDRITAEDFGAATFSPFVVMDWKSAASAAEASTARWRDGEPLGPLDGIPVPIKDHHRMKGLQTDCGTPYYGAKTGPATEDSEVVRRLREGGAVLIGKSHTTEWGLQPTGFNPHFSMPRNPWDRQRAAGGSSTGTGVAVALGFSPVGLASDGGGSIRIPSALNGVYGLKPSFQRLSRQGDHWQFGTVSHNGPIGQTTADLVDFLAVTGATPDPDDRATRYAPQTQHLVADWRRALGRGVEAARIGLWSWAFDVADERLAAPCRSAARALEAEGAEVVDVQIPYSEFHQAIGALTIGVEAVGFLHEAFQEMGDHTGDDVRLMLTALSTLAAWEYMLAQRTRAVLRRTLADVFSQVDVLLAPTTNMLAPSYPLEDDRVAIYDDQAIVDLCRFSFLANITGVPAGSVPIARIDGLPAGLQVIGDAWDEASVLAVMAHCERMGLSGLGTPPGYQSLLGR